MTTDPQRAHDKCWLCKQPLDVAVSHCPSKNCPWCRSCAQAKGVLR
jgi:hypothetical protein